ncbi:peptide methionine sulfoxide reductase [Protaetiibacter sp. SSC-01]|uniref:peptide methionine sulfoxide reductase n=1 Tax=Protaetiibacter sp. SSC-01 TaxID=2759943 RepID=UPI001657045E|nr:peptide methionine sulfoxide reductase [Protaetiibacter sp. SSC-01]QNO38429.1 peptide methionine sulfoxide reductase [Protaetiibacter sp. SSC-01]
MSDAQRDDLAALVHAIPEGWTRMRLDGDAWGITRTTRAGGGVVTFDAQRLADGELLGANIWLTSRGAALRPCEVPAESVLRVLRGAADAAATREARP